MENKQTVNICERIFCNETITGAELVYDGGDVQMHNCHISDCSLVFSGCAARTIKFISDLYSSSGGDVLVEDLFQSIRDGNLSITGEV